MFKRFVVALSVLIATTAGFGAVQAFAWHVSGVEASATCSDNGYTLHISTSLSDNGPGAYVIKLDGSQVADGTFGAVDAFTKNVHVDTTEGDHVVRVNVVWHTEESSHFEVHVDFPECGCPGDQLEVSHVQDGNNNNEGDECQPPTTTTSVPPTTTTIVTTSTTVPSTTTTTPTSTVVPPATSSPSPPSPPTATPIATATLPFTGVGTLLWILGAAGLALVLIGADVRRRALRSRPAGEGFDAPERPRWDLRNTGWRRG